MNECKAPFDMDECSFYIECARALTDVLRKSIENDTYKSEIYSDAAFGLSLLLDYIAKEARAAADNEAAQPNRPSGCRDR